MANLNPPPTHNSPNPPKYSWVIRRRLMFTIVFFCMACIAYVLHRNLESGVAQTVVTMSFTVIGTVMTVYVFGAVQEDKNRGKVEKP